MRFTKMLSLITDVLNKDADTQVDVCLTSQMASAIELWTAMYENHAPWVDRQKTKSAQIPAAIASEIARLLHSHTLHTGADQPGLSSDIPGSKTGPRSLQ